MASFSILAVGISCSPYSSGTERSRGDYVASDGKSKNPSLLPGVSLGLLRPGQDVSKSLMLGNTTSRRVVVDRIETSCGCIRVAPESFEVDAGRSADLSISFDPRESPDFRGNLSVEVFGRGPAGQVVFKTIVDVTVQDQRPAASQGGRVSTGKD